MENVIKLSERQKVSEFWKKEYSEEPNWVHFNNESEHLSFNEMYLTCGGGYYVEGDHCNLEDYLKHSSFSKTYKEKFMELYWEHKNEHYENFYKENYFRFIEDHYKKPYREVLKDYNSHPDSFFTKKKSNSNSS